MGGQTSQPWYERPPTPLRRARKWGRRHANAIPADHQLTQVTLTTDGTLPELEFQAFASNHTSWANAEPVKGSFLAHDMALAHGNHLWLYAQPTAPDCRWSGCLSAATRHAPRSTPW